MEILKLIYKILSNQILLSLFSGFVGTAIGGFIAYKVTDKTYKDNLKIEEHKRQNTEESLKKLIIAAVKQILIMLNATFDVIKGYKSPYGYIIRTHRASEYIFPLFNDLVKNINVIEDELYQKTVIEIYTELQSFLDINKIYKEDLKRLNQYRKEMLKQEDLWNINLLDYFDMDQVIYEKQQKKDSKFSYEFFKYQDVLIQNLKEKSNMVETLYTMLKNKMEKFLETYNARK